MAPTATPYASRMKEFGEPMAKKMRLNSEIPSTCLVPSKTTEPKIEDKFKSQWNRKYPSYKLPTFVKKSPQSSPEEEKKKHQDPKSFVVPKPTMPLPRPEELFVVRKRGTV